MRRRRKRLAKAMLELADAIHQQLAKSMAELRRARPDESVVCVWDLAVIDFERRAWLEAVLKNLEGPDLDAYLNG